MPRYPLPSDTSTTLNRFTNCQNPGLLFEHYTPDLGSGDDAKRKALENVQQCKPDRRALDAYRKRWKAMVSAANAAPFEAQTDWRFITGVGRRGPSEVGFTFHRIYGFPTIPGSGLKGLARAWAYFSLLEADPESQPESDPDFVAIFGRAPEGKEEENAANAGGAVFFEAVPLDDPDLDMDVMTPHYSQYYGDNTGRVAPTDDQNPIPIPFLTVKPGVRFAFAVGWRGDPNPQAQALAIEWLQKGLEKLGAGAKTGAGYGFWQLLGRAGISEPQVAAGQAQPDEPATPPAKLTWRRGKVVWIDPSKKQLGELEDLETQQRYRFSVGVIEGNTPGKKSRVHYVVEEREGEVVVIKVKKGR